MRAPSDLGGALALSLRPEVIWLGWGWGWGHGRGWGKGREEGMWARGEARGKEGGWWKGQGSY